MATTGSTWWCRSTTARTTPSTANIAIARRRHAAARLDTGLNKELTEFKRFWDAGHLAVVQGVGLPEPRPQPLQLDGHVDVGHPDRDPVVGLDGPLARRSTSARRKNLFAAAEIGHSLPLHLVGRRQRGTTVPAGRPAFGADTSAQAPEDLLVVAHDQRAEPPTWKGRVGQAMVDQLDVAKHARPIIPTRCRMPTPMVAARGDGAADQRQPRLPGVHRRMGRLRQPRQRTDDAPDPDGRAQRRGQPVLRDARARRGSTG